MKNFKKSVLVGALILTTSAALSACSIGDVADKFAGGVERFAEKHSKKITGPTVRKTLTNQTFDKIDATIDGGDIQIETGKEFAVKYHGKKKIIPKVTVQNGTLKLSQKIGNNFSINSGDAEVTIVVPKKMSSINVLSEGGDIELDSIKADTLKLSSEGGDIDLEHVTTNWGKANSEGGDIEASDLKTKTGFTISSEGGDVDISRNNASGYDISAEGGDISVNNDDVDGSTYKRNVHSANVLKVSAEGGDVDIE